jgi:hypothetical protein
MPRANLERFWAGLCIAACLIARVSLGAQSPWKVTLTSSANPLEIGGCGTISLELRDASGNRPRNTSGNLVYVFPDFDMSISATQDNAAVGEFNGPSIWRVCPCRGTPVGTVATITASYPARSLVAEKRVPGVEFQTTVTLPIVAGKNSYDPPGCAAQKVATTIAGPVGTPPPIAVRASPPPAATQPMVTAPVVPPRAEALKAGPPTAGPAKPALVNPTGFTVRDRSLDRTIGGVDFQWNKVPGAVRYRVTGTGLSAAGLTPVDTFIATGTIPSGPGSWRLVAVYPGNLMDTTTAAAGSLVVRRLPPHSLPWLTHRNGAGAMVQVQTPAHQVLNPAAGGVPIGNLGGDLAAAYDPVDAAWLGQVFNLTSLTMNPLDGSMAPAYFRPSGDATTECVSNDDQTYGCSRVGVKLWLDTRAGLWDETGQPPNEAIYGNPGDLGVGRRAFCEQRLRGPPVPGLYTICYATAHGIPPGQPGFNDPQTITHPNEGTVGDYILSMVIAKDASGTVFLAFGKEGSYPLLPTVRLDTEGPKFVPFACLSCHGGTYNPVTRKVDGASLLPLDPELLAFASPADQAAQEEKIRRINQMVVNSDPTSAIAVYIRGLYNGAASLSQPGARAKPDFVPAGWAAQAGFYRQVVRPYCALCHLAAPAAWNFASWTNFQSNAALIRADVCMAHIMPHGELQYKAFWTKDTGPLYLPGLLATTLGFPSC